MSKTRYLNNPTRNVVPCGVACTPSYQRLEETPPCRIVASLRDAFVLQACNFTTLHSLRSLSMVLLRFSIYDAVWKLLIHGQLYGDSCEHKHKLPCNYPLILVAVTGRKKYFCWDILRRKMRRCHSMFWMFFPNAVNGCAQRTTSSKFYLL